MSQLSRCAAVCVALATLSASACDGSAAPPAATATDAPPAAAIRPATDGVPANPQAPGWLELQGGKGPVKGRYACQDWAGYTSARVQADALYGGEVRRSSYFTSEFSITGEASYVYHGAEQKQGGFTYTPATGEVRWTSGPYSSEPGEAATITGIYGVHKSDGTPTIVQIFRDPAYGEAAELCFRYKD
jgi:hypothetical protein